MAPADPASAADFRLAAVCRESRSDQLLSPRSSTARLRSYAIRCSADADHDLLAARLAGMQSARRRLALRRSSPWAHHRIPGAFPRLDVVPTSTASQGKISSDMSPSIVEIPAGLALDRSGDVFPKIVWDQKTGTALPPPG